MRYNLIPKRLPGPGVMNYAFQPNQSLPPIALGGPGVPVLNPFDIVLNTPQLYFGGAQVVDGLSGIQTGDFGSQGLVEWDKFVNGQPTDVTPIVGAA